MAAEQTMVRISKEARDLADVIAQKMVDGHAATLPFGIYTVSQGAVIEKALEEFKGNHPELGIE